jgi:orotate phosphoribosyltransferase
MINNQLSEKEVIEIFEKCDAIKKGHFLLSSGLHSGTYLEKFQVLQYPHYTFLLCKEIIRRFNDSKIDVVIGAVTGGIILSYEVARQLNIRAIFTERENNVMKLRRGFTIDANEYVLIVEDILTTGGSVKELINVVREYSNNIVGVGILINRSGVKPDFGIRVETLANIKIETYPPDKCPLCKDAIPLIKPGSKKV